MNDDEADSFVSVMLRTIERIDRIERETPCNEFRLHPDDFHDLRMQVPSSTPMGLSIFSGIPIVLDEGAERLPRKSKDTK